MFGDLNSVQLIGNMTRDVEVRYTPNGKSVANFAVATNHSYRLPDSTEWKDEVTFHNLVMFGNSVEMFSQRAHKGTRVFVQGRIQTRSWQDKEGKTNYKTEVIVDKVILLDRYERGPAQGGTPSKFNNTGSNGNFSDDASFESGENFSAPSNPAPAKGVPAKAAKPKDDNRIDPDDLPF
jgi:single-strand DNA-binding protein